jgi:hypothetical protein
MSFSTERPNDNFHGLRGRLLEPMRRSRQSSFDASHLKTRLHWEVLATTRATPLAPLNPFGNDNNTSSLDEENFCQRYWTVLTMRYAVTHLFTAVCSF